MNVDKMFVTIEKKMHYTNTGRDGVPVTMGNILSRLLRVRCAFQTSYLSLKLMDFSG